MAVIVAGPPDTLTTTAVKLTVLSPGAKDTVGGTVSTPGAVLPRVISSFTPAKRESA